MDRGAALPLLGPPLRVAGHQAGQLVQQLRVAAVLARAELLVAVARVLVQVAECVHLPRVRAHQRPRQTLDQEGAEVGTGGSHTLPVIPAPYHSVSVREKWKT